MKKFSLVSLAIAAAFAITPGALIGQSYNFLEFTGGGTTVTGTFTLGAEIGNSPLDYNFATFNGTVVGSNLDSGGSVAVTLASAYGSPNPGGNGLGFPGGGAGNNQFYPDANATASGVSGPPAYLDGWGLVLTDANGDIINIFANGGGSYYFFDDVNLGSGNYSEFQGTVSNGSLAVPESSSLLMLVLCAFGLTGGFFFRARKAGLFPRS